MIQVVNFENALENQAILDQKSVSKLKFLTKSKKIPEVGTEYDVPVFLLLGCVFFLDFSALRRDCVYKKWHPRLKYGNYGKKAKQKETGMPPEKPLPQRQEQKDLLL